jgi:hypothetical protein
VATALINSLIQLIITGCTPGFNDWLIAITNSLGGLIFHLDIRRDVKGLPLKAASTAHRFFSLERLFIYRTCIQGKIAIQGFNLSHEIPHPQRLAMQNFPSTLQC